jgi:translocation and assembly module TamB
VKALRLAVKTLAALAGATLLLASLLVLVLWALGTRGVPVTVRIAEQLLGSQLQVAHAYGGLLGPITLDGIVFESEAARVEIDHLSLRTVPRDLLRRQLHVESLAVGTVRVTLKPHVASAPRPLSTRLPLELVVDALTAEQVRVEPGQGAAIVLSSIAARGGWQGDRLSLASLALEEPRLGALRAMAQLRLEPRRIGIEALQLQGPGTVAAAGFIGLLGEPSDLHMALREAHWPFTGVPRLRLPTLNAGLRGVIDAASRDLRISVDGALRAAVGQQALGFDLKAALALKGDDATLEQLSLVSTDGAGRLDASGHARWQPALQVDAQATCTALDPGVLLPDWKGRLNGQLKAETVEASATVDSVPEVRFSASIDRSTLRGYPLSLATRGVVAVAADQRRLVLDQFSLKSGSASLDAQGAFWPALDAQVRAQVPDLRALLPSLAGALQLQARAQGALQSSRVQAQGQLRGLHSPALALASATLSADLDLARESRLQLDASGLAVGNRRVSGASFTLQGRPQAMTVKAEVTATQPRAALAVQLQGALDLAQRRWQGTLQQASLTPPAGQPWLLRQAVPLVVQPDAQRLQEACWQSAATEVCLETSRSLPPAGGPARIEAKARVQQFDLAAFDALLPAGWQLHTVLQGHAELSLVGTVPQAVALDLRHDAGTLQLPNTPLLHLKPGSLGVQQRDGQWVADAALAVDQGNLAFEASVPMAGDAWSERPLGGKLAVDVPDLAVLQPFVKGVDAVQGAVQARFTLAGTAGAPRAEGSATLERGHLHVPALGITVSDIHARVDGTGADALAIHVQATSGKGVLNIDGTARFPDGKPDVALTVAGDDVQVADMADARVWISPRLAFAQNAEGLRLTGTVQVPKADITPRKIAGNAIGASNDQVLVGADAPSNSAPLPLTAQVTVSLGDAVTFEGFGLKSRLGGEVTALDEPGGAGTRGRGELQLIDAVYRAYGQELKLETGRILFNGGLINEPTIDLRASRQPREGISVALHVRGTLVQPTFDLSSSPPMPREQQLGWLLFGRPIDGGGQLSGAAAALSLGLAGGDALASRFGSVLGLDQVSLGGETDSTVWKPTDPNVVSTNTGTEQARFTVGKYLSPRLFVSYGVGLFQNNGNVLRLLYDLGHGFKLRTESGLETGGDVLYSREH